MALSNADGLRSFNPNFRPSDREKWICIYPAYLNSRKTIAEGRQICRQKAIDNPLASEIRDVLSSSGLNSEYEDKIYPREKDRLFKGRVRVQILKDNGTPVLPQFAKREDVFEYVCATIPKLKSRSSQSSQQHSISSNSTNTSKKSKNKKK